MRKCHQLSFYAAPAAVFFLTASCKTINGDSLKSDFVEGETVLGRGHNSLTGEARGDCIVPTPLVDNILTKAAAGSENVPAESNAKGGQVVTSEMTLITSSSQLIQSIGVESDISARYALLVNAKNKTSALQAKTIDENSLNLLVKVVVKNTSKSMRDVKLKTDNAKLLATNPKYFFRKCGDKYVSGVTTGGAFYALLEIKTSSKDERTKIENDLGLNVNYGLASVNPSVKFSYDRQQILKNNAMNVTMVQLGGSGEDARPLYKFDEIIERTNKFPSIIEKTAVPLSGNEMSYASVDIPDGVTAFFDDSEINYVSASLRRLWDEYGDKQSSLALIERIQSKPLDYPQVNLSEITGRREQFLKRNEDLIKLAHACYKDPYVPCQYQADNQKYVWPTYDPSEQIVDEDFPAVNFSTTPRLVSGDAEFYSHGPDVTISAKYSVEGAQVYLVLSSIFQETKNGDTRAEGLEKKLIYTAPQGYKVDRVLSAEYPALVRTIMNGHDARIVPSALGDFNIRGDTVGYDVGRYTGYDATLVGRIKVRLLKN